MNAATPIALSTNYTLLRTLTAQVAEPTAPVAGAMVVTTQALSYADVLIVGTSCGGTTLPDVVIYKIWRLVGSTVELVDTYSTPASAIATPVTRSVKCGASKLWITVDFLGGSAPTCTGTVYIRPVFDASLTKTDLTYDSSGNLKTSDLAFDSASGANKSFSIFDVSDKYVVPEVLLDLSSSVSIVTASYDVDMRSYSSCFIAISGVSYAANALAFRFEHILDIGAASPLNVVITSASYNIANNSFLSPDSTGNIYIPTVATKYCCHYADIGPCVLRVVLTAVANAGNSLKIVVGKKY